MDVIATLDAPVAPDDLFVWVDDLTRYPSWLELVPKAETAAADAGDPGPAWSVQLRGRLGPLARSKRLRMVRTVCDAPAHVVFERREVDARKHAPWVLDARIDPAPEGVSRLTMRLHYGGALWGPVLERMLGEEIERSRPRLLALLG